MTKNAIAWIREDFRVEHNPALSYAPNISFDRYKQLHNKWEKAQTRERKYRRKRQLMSDTDIDSKKKGLW